MLPSVGRLHPGTLYKGHGADRVISELCCWIDFEIEHYVYQIPPCVLVRREVADECGGIKCTGIVFKPVTTYVSTIYKRYSKKKLPKLVWAQVSGRPGVDDFGMDRVTRLIVSRRVREVFDRHEPTGIRYVPGSSAPSDSEIAGMVLGDSG